MLFRSYMVVSPNDGRQRRKVEQPIVTRKWLEVTGVLFPEVFHHFCADEWVEKIATKSGLVAYCMEITMEHMHPKYGKAEWDDVYKRKRDEQGHLRQMEDKQALIDLAPQIDELVEKLKVAARVYEEKRLA